MKKLKYLSFSLVFLFACQKEVLEKSPIIGITEENFYKTEADAVSAVNGAYAALQFELTPAAHFRWFWGDIMSDDSEKGGSGPNDAPNLAALENFQGPTNTDFLEAEWAANYEGIYRANVVLERVPPIEMDETKKAQVLGEARAIRAWFHFLQVTYFGDVPLVDHVLAPSEYRIGKSPAADVWALIEQDLVQAVADLPKRSEYPLADLGRITQGAAQGLLLKAYLFQSKWAEAKAVAEDIIASGEYRLVDNYNQIFTSGGENNEESIFEIQYMNASGGNWGRNNANEGSFSNVFQRARGQFEGFGFNLPTQDFIDEFFSEGVEDPRLKATVFREGDLMGDRGFFTKDATGFPHDYYPKKYFSNKSEDAPFGDPNPNGGSNDRVIRYADVLLMHAEAAFHTGDETGAKNSLNQVRRRVGMREITDVGPALLRAIYHERRVELGLEGHRFFDLVRTGRAAEVLGALGYNDDVHKVLPIPDSQIQASDGALTQNPGY